MASAVTDKFRKVKSLFSTTLSSGVDDSTGTIPLNSVSGLPTDTGITVTIDRVDSDGVATGRLERAICTISGSNLVNCVRGNDSTTGQTHPSGAVVEMVWDADSVNDIIDGIVAEHSQAGLHAGTRMIDLPATAMWPATTAGCAALAKTELGTNDIDIQTLDFDTTTQEYAQFAIRMPTSWDAGTVTFIPFWTAASGSGTVVWSLAGISYANDDAMDAAVGTVQTSTDTLITANDMHVGPTSSAITIAGTPTAGEYVHFKISRVTGSDTLGVDAKLLGIQIIYTSTKLNVT
tara:strand:- start:2871 stop:3743 length:873 start_codon:yes stop_codon:yes gene_type:complete